MNRDSSKARFDATGKQSDASSPFVVRIREWLPEIVLLAVTTAAGVWARGRWFDPIGDAGIWWSYVYRLAHGERLYRDVFIQFGPLSPYLMSFGARIFGTSSTYFLFACWIAAVVAGLLLLRVGRRFLTTFERLALVGLVIAVSLFAPGPGLLVLPYAPAAVHALAFSLGALLLLNSRRSDLHWRAWIAGALAGLAFCSKQEIGVAAIVALGASLLSFSRRGLTWFLRCLAGFLIVASSGAIFVLSSAPIESLRASHLWPLVLRPPQRWKALYQIVAGVDAVEWQSHYLESMGLLLFYLSLLAILGVLLAREWRPRGWLPPLALLIVLFSLGGMASSLNEWFHPIQLSMATAFGVAALAPVLAEPEDRISLVATGVFAGLVATRTAFSTSLGSHYSGVGHFATSLTWVLFMCLLAPRLMPGPGKAGDWTRKAAALLTFAVAWYAAVASMLSLAAPSRVSFEMDKGPIWVEPRIRRVFDGIQRVAKRGEKVWVLPETNGVDALFELRNVSPYEWHLPGSLDQQAERNLIAALDQNSPDLVVVFDRPVPEYKIGPFGVGYDLILAGWIERNYVVLDSSPGGKIFRRRETTTIPGS
jgi:hypothetical protein